MKAQQGKVPGKVTPDAKRRRARRLITPEYVSLFTKWGYDIRVNECCDDLEVNGRVIDDLIKDTILSKVTDYGTENNISTSVGNAGRALSVMGLQNSYHPIKDYLSALAWDGSNHIETLCSYFKDKDGVFYRWFRHWVIGAVAKVHGDHQNPMFVLDGPQDIGKSEFAKWLGSPLPMYFNASSIQPENKDHRLRLLRTWIWEVEELGTTTRKADTEALKAFITLQHVRERKPYGKFEIIKPALSSFLGTINNQSGFLVDRSGNRRFLACTLESIDWAYSKEVDVNQVWAEAMAAYLRGKDYWGFEQVDRELRDKLNEKYKTVSPIEDYLDGYLEYTHNPLDWVLATQIYNHLGICGIKPAVAVTMTIGAYLKSKGAGIDKKRMMVMGKRQQVFTGVKAP